MSGKFSKKTGVTILIPCLNEVRTVAVVAKQAYAASMKSKVNFEIVVADNGSTDGTLEKLRFLSYVRVVPVPVRGYGAALHYGILHAKYPYVLYGDADCSYDFRELKKFVPFMIKSYDLVLGSRLAGTIQEGAMPFLNRYLGTPILTALIKWIYGIAVSDCNSGMRMVRREFYRKLDMKNSGMEWASELLIKTALKAGYYAEVPIIFKKDKRKTLPHLKRWEDGWRHLKVIVLLKPSLVLMTSIVCAFIAILFLPHSIFTTIALLLFSEFVFLSYLVTKKIEEVVTFKENWVSAWLEKLPLVLIGVVITILGLLTLFLISDQHLYTKYIVFFQVVLYDLWLFFIETVKTHMVHVLKVKPHATR